MIKFTTNLKEEMDRNIRNIESEEGEVLKRVYLTARMLEEMIGRLKAFIVQYTFADREEEIFFFREIKPRFFCHLLFYLKVYYIEVNKPMGSLELQKEYLGRELDHLSYYISKRLDFYRYYRSGATHRDHLYFMRGVVSWEEQYIDGFYFERDPKFSSGCDFTVAKILSYDMLQIYLREELERNSEDALLMKELRPMTKDKVRWTDKKVRLIAILYALDTLGSIDDGDISLRGLQEFFEYHLDVKLGNIARAFNEMRLRHNPVKYIEEMRDALQKRMEETDNRSHSYYSGGISFPGSSRT